MNSRRHPKRRIIPNAGKPPVTTVPADDRRRLAVLTAGIDPERMREAAAEARAD